MAGIAAAVSGTGAKAFTGSVRLTISQQALTNASVHDFMILEYNDVIGGRAAHTGFGKQADGSPYILELGANWVCWKQTR